MSAKYIRLAGLLRKIILENVTDGFKLPTEAELCKRYDVSRQTVRKALSLLESENIIIRKQGSGTYATGLFSSPSRNVVAILVTSDSEYIYPALITDIRSSLQGQGFSVTVYATENRACREREILKEFLDSPVRGIIAEGCKTVYPTPNADLYRQLQSRGTSILFLHGNYSNLPEYPYIKDDNYGGGYYLGKYLVSLGHRQIAGIFKSDDIQGLERQHGFLCSLRDEGVSFQDEDICLFDSQQLSALQEKQDTGFLSEFVGKKLKSCTAVICYNDEIAYWLMKELKYAGLQVPEDISVVCFDNSYLSELSATQITSLSHKKHEMGTAAAESLIKLMKGSSAASEKIPWHLAAKHSASAPGGGK